MPSLRRGNKSQITYQREVSKTLTCKSKPTKPIIFAKIRSKLQLNCGAVQSPSKNRASLKRRSQSIQLMPSLSGRWAILSFLNAFSAANNSLISMNAWNKSRKALYMWKDPSIAPLFYSFSTFPSISTLR